MTGPDRGEWDTRHKVGLYTHTETHDPNYHFRLSLITIVINIHCFKTSHCHSSDYGH